MLFCLLYLDNVANVQKKSDIKVKRQTRWKIIYFLYVFGAKKEQKSAINSVLIRYLFA